MRNRSNKTPSIYHKNAKFPESHQQSTRLGRRVKIAKKRFNQLNELGPQGHPGPCTAQCQWPHNAQEERSPRQAPRQGEWLLFIRTKPTWENANEHGLYDHGQQFLTEWFCWFVNAYQGSNEPDKANSLARLAWVLNQGFRQQRLDEVWLASCIEWPRWLPSRRD